MSKRTYDGEVVVVDNESSPAAASVARVVGGDHNNPVQLPESTSNGGSDDDDNVAAVAAPPSPSTLKNHPMYTSEYNFVKKDVKVFAGKLHLVYSDDRHNNRSSFAVGAYCEMCDKEFKYDSCTNPHTVTNHCRTVHKKEMEHLLEEQKEKELSLLKSSGGKKLVKQSSISMFVQSEASKLPAAPPQIQEIFCYKTDVEIASCLIPFLHVWKTPNCRT
jgi:hypothetical protein